MGTTVEQAPGLFRTDLQHAELSIPGRIVIQNRVEIHPEAPLIRHKHPGEEVIYVLEGKMEYVIEGHETLVVSAGEALTVPADTVHTARPLDGTASELATYIVEKDKPFLVIVDD
jgi:quercetin dioxygenase-like cupin family protein